MEVPENLTEAMMDAGHEPTDKKSDDKENASPNDIKDKKVKFMVSGIYDEERTKCVQ